MPYVGSFKKERYGSCLLQTGGLSGFPALRIWMHSPPLHRSHSDFRHGVSAIGICINLRISFFSIHHNVSMNNGVWVYP